MAQIRTDRTHYINLGGMRSQLCFSLPQIVIFHMIFFLPKIIITPQTTVVRRNKYEYVKTSENK